MPESNQKSELVPEANSDQKSGPEVEPRPEGAENLPSFHEEKNPDPESIEPDESRKEDIRQSEIKTLGQAFLSVRDALEYCRIVVAKVAAEGTADQEDKQILLEISATLKSAVDYLSEVLFHVPDRYYSEIYVYRLKHPVPPFDEYDEKRRRETKDT